MMKETSPPNSKDNEDNEIEPIMVQHVEPCQPPKSAPTGSQGIHSRPANEIGFPYAMKCPYCCPASCEEDNNDNDDKMITVVTKDVDAFRLAFCLLLVALAVWVINVAPFLIFYVGLALFYVPVRIIMLLFCIVLKSNIMIF